MRSLNFCIGLFGLILVILDRLLKWLVFKNPDFYSGRFFDLRLFKNTKLFFISLNHFLLYFLIATILLVFIVLFFKTKDAFLKFGFYLIVLGGLSNFFDRIYFGYVIDYLRIFILPISFFNLADLMIIFGISLVLLESVRSSVSNIVFPQG